MPQCQRCIWVNWLAPTIPVQQEAHPDAGDQQKRRKDTPLQMSKGRDEASSGVIPPPTGPRREVAKVGGQERKQKAMHICL